MKLNIGQDNVLVAKYSRSIINDVSDDQIGKRVLEVLIKVVKEYIPHFSFEKHHLATHAEILWFERYECPCCQTGVEALVKVKSNGGCSSKEWKEGAENACGLYNVHICAQSLRETDHLGSKFKIEKVSGFTEFASGFTEHLTSQSERK
ncbi:MAG: hypothetical protein US10_C0039G0004 [Candidatus Moranbacteria bacterium GW2011_GWD2_36_198]|nr:MAG: hypothetical protein US10_C0039G0004 [Candidatus Moranbacteria bacterium GW2011_GWD2_36_198]